MGKIFSRNESSKFSSCPRLKSHHHLDSEEDGTSVENHRHCQCHCIASSLIVSSLRVIIKSTRQNLGSFEYRLALSAKEHSITKELYSIILN